MEKEGNPFNLFYVPVSHDTAYEINFYQPQVKGTLYLGFFAPDGVTK